MLPADLLYPAPSLLQCTRSDLQESLPSFHLCLFRVLLLHLFLCRLQAVNAGGFNKSQPHSNYKDRALCLSHHFQLLLCLTYSPKPQCVTLPHCYHTLICNLNPKCCIFSFPNSTVSTPESTVNRCSPKCSSFSGLCHSGLYHVPPLE